MLYYVIENGVLRELLLVVTNTPADKKHFFVKKTPKQVSKSVRGYLERCSMVEKMRWCRT